MSHVLIFDTETSGLPPYQMKKNKRIIASPEKYLSDWEECRIVEIAWSIYTYEGIFVKSYSSLIRPDNFQIPQESTKIHGITQEQAINHGKPIQEVLHRFQEDLKDVYTLVAHNIQFDYNVVLSEMIRQSFSIDAFKTKRHICTMLDSTKEHTKWPTLKELYKTCFQEELNQTHRALDDVQACAKIFFHLFTTNGS